MAKVEQKDNFDYLGEEFQIRLITQIILDKRFGESIIDILNPNYFKDPALKYIVATIKESYQEYNIVPDFGSLEFRIKSNGLDEIKNTYNTQFIEKIRNAELNDSLEVQKMGMKFCQTQELKKAVIDIHKIIERDDMSKYDECEQILRKALDHGINKDDGINVLDNVDAVLAEDFRNPIPTGIRGLDEIMDGGLSRGELGIILAPFGAGKTTMITKLANTAKDAGFNVLQIFFEDDKKQIQRKHFACWSGIELNDLGLHKDLIKKIVKQKSSEPGILKLKRFPSDGTTITTIKKYIRKLIAQGFKPDMVLLDYIDCIEPSKKVDDVNVGEGKVMREFESLLSEYDIAGWTAVQGNRSSIRAEIVEGDQMGGSIKKAQIGHFIVSIAKTLEQKDNNTATMAILKSRFSKSGQILENVIFDNGKVQIEMVSNNNIKTRTEHNAMVSAEGQNVINQFLNEKQKRRNVLEQNNNVLP